MATSRSHAFGNGIVFSAAFALMISADSVFADSVGALAYVRFFGLAAVLLVAFRYSQSVKLLGARPGIFLLGVVVAGFISSCLSEQALLAVAKLAPFSVVSILLFCKPAAFSRVLSRCDEGRIVAHFFAVLVLASALISAFNGTGLCRNPNLSAQLCLCAVPFFLAQHKSNWGSYWGFMVAIATGHILLLWSRTSVAGLFVTLCAFYIIRGGSRRPEALFLTAFATVVSGLLLVSFFYEGLNFYLYKGDSVVLDANRTFMMEESLERWKERPVFGFGFGLSWVQADLSSEEFFGSARLGRLSGEFGNSILAVLVGGGLSLLIALSLYILATLSAAAASLRRFSVGDDRRLIAVLISGMLGFLVHSQGEGWIISATNWIAVLFYGFVGACGFVGSLGVSSSQANRP